MRKCDVEAINAFVGECVDRLARSSITVEFVNKRALEGGHSGEFDYESRCLRVATRKKIDDWSIVFLHEYCHFLQWKWQTKWWIRSDRINSCGTLWEWLDGIDVNTTKLRRACHVTQRMEQECDRIAVSQITERQLPVDVPQYIAQSNAYIQLYPIACKVRKWPSIPPYSVDGVISTIQDQFMAPNQYQNPSDQYVRLVMEHCYAE